VPVLTDFSTDFPGAANPTSIVLVAGTLQLRNALWTTSPSQVSYNGTEPFYFSDDGARVQSFNVGVPFP
jgi:hypothetical protein